MRGTHVSGIPGTNCSKTASFNQFVFEFSNVSSELLCKSLRVFFFEVSRYAEIQKLKQWVKFEPGVSLKLALNNWPQSLKINYYSTRRIFN
jgi:hypothetical protein